MKYVFFYLLVFLTIAECVPAYSKDAENGKSTSLATSKSKLSKDQTVKIAQSAAQKHGFNLQDFHGPEVHYEPIKKDRLWTVFFRNKGMTVGGDFMVVIDDNNGTHQVVVGH